jgi:hypothetical protein
MDFEMLDSAASTGKRVHAGSLSRAGEGMYLFALMLAAWVAACVLYVRLFSVGGGGSRSDAIRYQPTPRRSQTKPKAKQQKEKVS